MREISNEDMMTLLQLLPYLEQCQPGRYHNTVRRSRLVLRKWLHADEFNACRPKKVLFFDRSTGQYSLNGQHVGFMEQLTDNL